MKRMLAVLAAVMTAVVNVVAETSPRSYDEIDITAAVRGADKGKTTLGYGTPLDGTTIENAFGAGEATGDRVLMSVRGNGFDWTIDPSYERGKPIYVTRYSIKRAVPLESGAGYVTAAEQRAPSEFLLQGSLDGTYWMDLDHRTNINWVNSGVSEMSFEVAPQNIASFRRYRFVTVNTQADSGDGCKCSFQYVRFFGAVGTDEPLLESAKTLEYLHSKGEAVAFVGDYVPTLDSRLELDVSFNKVTGTQCIFAAKDPNDSSLHFRLFHMDDGWVFFYGSENYHSNIKAYAGVRYKVVVDGPIVTVNGVEVCNAGEKLMRSANQKLCLCHNSLGDSDPTLYNVADLKIWSVKCWDGSRNPKLDLQPMLHRDGTGMFYDSVGKRCYQSTRKSNRLPVAFCIESGEHEITEKVRVANAQTVKPVEESGTEEHSSFPAVNLFNGDDTSTDGRAIFAGYANAIQYDIADTYLPGSPIVVTRYALLPSVGTASGEMQGSQRAPIQFELRASADGQTWVTLHKQMEGVSEGNYRIGNYKDNGYGFDGLTFNIPEDKRGDYRHYQFLTYKSSCKADDPWKTSLQAIKFYGYEGGAISHCKPVGYVQNGLLNGEETKVDGTRFLTGVQPAKADLTVELNGVFTRTDVTECLFCSRGANNDNAWVLFLMEGKFYLIYGSSDCSYTSDFPVRTETPYTITVKGNEMFVNGASIGSAPGSTGFKPATEIALLSSHNGKIGWGNQARFKLASCRILDSVGGVVRDYIPAVRASDNVGGLFDRVNAKFLAAEGPQPRVGAAVDMDIRQGGRSLALENEPSEKEQLPTSLQFAFGENQILPEGLYAAFDNKRHAGTSSNDWAKVVKLTDVTSGIDSFSVEKLQNEEHYKYVKFFLGDELGYGAASTKIFTACKMGLFIVVY